MSPTSTHEHQAAASSSPLWSPGIPMSTHTKGLVIIAKRKNHTRRQTQTRRV